MKSTLVWPCAMALGMVACTTIRDIQTDRPSAASPIMKALTQANGESLQLSENDNRTAFTAYSNEAKESRPNIVVAATFDSNGDDVFEPREEDRLKTLDLTRKLDDSWEEHVLVTFQKDKKNYKNPAYLIISYKLDTSEKREKTDKTLKLFKNEDFTRFNERHTTDADEAVDLAIEVFGLRPQ